MIEQPLHSGDTIDVVVTKSLPFGVLVETDTGLAGLVRGANSAVGTSIRVEVVQYDNSDSRFSASMARPKVDPATAEHCGRIDPPIGANATGRQPPPANAGSTHPLSAAISTGQRNAWARTWDGVMKPRVCRGLPFSRAATSSRSAWV